MLHPKHLALAASLTLALALTSCGARRSVPEEISPTKPHPTSPQQPEDKGSMVEHKPWVRPTGDSIREEMRAVWLTTVYGLDWPKDRADTPDGVRRQKESLIRILDRLKQDGYNTVFLQVRHSGTTIYPTDYEPLSSRLAGEGYFGDYDPVRFALTECRRRGLSMHAWFVTYPLASSKRSPHPILRDHPSWAIHHKGSYHLDPGNPEVRSYVAHLVTDFLRRYAVDGIHFDYFRYPEEAERFNDKASFIAHGLSYPTREAWRRDNLTQQLREVRDSLRGIHSQALVSVAPLGKLQKIPDLGRPHGWTAYESVYQDPVTWGKEGLVDFVVPMMYYRDVLFEPFLRDWKELVAPYIPVVPGLAPYRIEETGWPSEVIEEQIDLAREEGLAGVCFFRETHTGGRFPAVRRIIQEAFKHPALPVAYPRGLAHKPAVPQHLDAAVGQDGTILVRWSMPREASADGTTYRLWAVTTDAHGRREATLLSSTLRDPHCLLVMSDLIDYDCIELGVEAVNAFGVSTPCTEGLELNLAALREEIRHPRR